MMNINNNMNITNESKISINSCRVETAKKEKQSGIINQNNINTSINLEQTQINNRSCNPINNMDEGKELLKVFIYIYYYEKSLKEKNIFINNSNEIYYLTS